MYYSCNNMSIFCVYMMALFDGTVVGSSSTQGSQFFFEMTVLGELCCVAWPFCFVVVVVSLPSSAS